MRPGLILPEISKRKHLRQSQITETKKDQLIKAFEHKLRIHEQQIDKNNNVISGMTKNFQILRQQLMKQKQYSEEISTTNKKLKDQIQRINRTSRSSRNKFDEVQKLYTKEIQNNQELQKKIKQFKEKQQSGLAYQEKRNKKLEQQNFNLSKQNFKLTKQIQQLKVSYQGKLDEQDNVSKMVEKYLQQMRQIKQQRNKLKQMNDQQESKLTSLNNDLFNISSQIVELKNTNKQLEFALTSKANEQKSKHATTIDQLKKQLSMLQISSQKTIKQLKLKIENSQNQNKEKIRQLTQELKCLKIQSKKQLDQSQSMMNKYKSKVQKLDNIIKLSGKIEQGQKLMIDNLQCQYCKQLLKEPVTIIPCGHCFCLGCKKGYQKECCQCGPKVKIDALYRNELLDDVLAIFEVVKEIRVYLK